MELERWFASLSPDGARSVERLGAQERRSLPGARADRQARLLHRRQRLPGARGLGAGAVSRGPLRRGPRAGDRHAARRLREGVRAEAAVLHSHDYTTLQELRRCFDEWRGLREVYGWREPASPAHLLAAAARRAGRARRELIAEGASAGAPPRDARGGRPPPCRAPRAARCSARAPTGCPPRVAAPAVARAARGLRAARPRRARRSVPSTATAHDERRRLTDARSPIAQSEPSPASALDGTFSGPLAGLRRRIYLTYRYLGWRTLLFRAAHASRCASRRCSVACGCARTRATTNVRRARRLVPRARAAGRHRDPELPRRRARARRSCASIRKTVPRGMARIDRRR